MPWTRAAGPFERIVKENQTLLKVSDLRTRFHTPEGVVFAVNGISFHLDESETLAIVGESGCGKSVSMMSLLQLIPIPPGQIVSGTAVYRGEDLLKKSESQMEDVRGKEIAMIFQDPMTSLNPVLTIGKQITESLCTHLGMDQALAERRAVELLERVGISDAKQRLNDYPHQFSGGQRQRVMIAMALACEPKVLIADEPTTALDVTIQAQIVELVAQLRDQSHMAIVWITHDLGVVAGLAHRVIVMYAGYIVEEAGVDDLYERPKHPYTLALLAALPRVDRKRDRRLKSIPGAPPNLLVEPRGCPFAPRCEFFFDRCEAENPPLNRIEPAHAVACWLHLNGASL
ncbi:MAG: ABC transporter ATP-binding protein [Anaerolineae bacterium]|nr:ABC transporter ATP-binding protein [Anaerolineae bacterium]